MNCTIVSSTIEDNKYYIQSITLRFIGAPTVKQVLATAKHYSMGGGLKPDFDNPNFEIHMTPDGEYTKVQFYPCISTNIKTTSFR